ncbi:MAG: hypothetical protein ACAH95_00600 [Fimbriimonas sp.]
MKHTLAIIALVAVAGFLVSAGPSASKGGLVVHGVRWETSLEAAKNAATIDRKPILHLQSFGKPGDPMACTNTRTLTATLLKDPQMIELMKGSVPSWELVREAAKVTIDFGGGKIVKRTLRGNTCLYVLRSDGTVVDAFPGVYEPARLLPELKKALEMVNWAPEKVAEWHRDAARTAERVARIAVASSKSGVESPLLATTVPDTAIKIPVGASKSETAFLRGAAQLFDVSSLPMSPMNARSAGGFNSGSTPKERGVRMLQLETDVNLTSVRGVVHLWLASLEKPITAPEAKRTMFETILHINYTDPYMGLKDVELPGSEG